MQLLIILALLLSGGAGGLNEVKPLLQSLGGEEAEKVLKEAEEISSVVSAVQALTGMQAKNGAKQPDGGEDGYNENTVNFPLSPVARVADESITHCLSRYIALGE